PCPPRIARASALLSASTNRDTFNRPWSVAEYTFGDAIRRHEAQYAARAAAALAAGIEPPPYQPYVTGLIPPDTPEGLEDQKMQQQTNEYWAAHFRAQIAERPDLQRALAEEEQREEANETQITEARINQIQAKAEEFLCNLPALFFPHSSFRPIGTRRKTALDRL
ncbi:MAG TPA: hypothetical protein VHT28_16330, partial [Silvibacterium sp.]|nr:hypothetical protein [Silvibacterium sp.]